MIWEGRKKKSCVVVFSPHCYLTPIIFQVITLLGFTHSFHALCGLVVVALNCGLIIVLVYPPNTQLKHRHPHRDRCHTKWLNWYVYRSAGTFIVSLSRCESTEPEPAASGLRPLFVPADSSGWFFCFSIHKLEFVIAKKSELQSQFIDLYYHHNCHWIL